MEIKVYFAKGRCVSILAVKGEEYYSVNITSDSIVWDKKNNEYTLVKEKVNNLLVELMEVARCCKNVVVAEPQFAALQYKTIARVDLFVSQEERNQDGEKNLVYVNEVESGWALGWYHDDSGGLDICKLKEWYAVLYNTEFVNGRDGYDW
ncbi:UNVERIFIED_CONTAM: hypothetical protein HDU68_011297, partial [Siphonaria sp. JEL0065]